MTLIPAPGQEPDNLPLQHDEVRMGLKHVLILVSICRNVALKFDIMTFMFSTHYLGLNAVHVFGRDTSLRGHDRVNTHLKGMLLLVVGLVLLLLLLLKGEFEPLGAHRLASRQVQ